MLLFLIRHGETDWVIEGRAQGHTDIPLNGKGRWQAERLAVALKGEPLDAVYSSPLSRALETAKSIARYHHLEVAEEPHLQELDQGDLEGLTREDMKELYPQVLDQWAANPAPLKMPGGESLEELQERAWEAIMRIFDSHPKGQVAAVTHSLALLSVICKALGVPLSNVRRLRQSIAGISVLEVDLGGCALLRFNDTSHLKET